MVEETKSILTSSSSLLPLRDESQLFVFLSSSFGFFLLLYVSVCEKEREGKRLLHVKKKKRKHTICLINRDRRTSMSKGASRTSNNNHHFSLAYSSF